MGKRAVTGVGVRWRKVAAFTILGLLVTGSLVMPVQSAEQREPELTDLKSVDDLKDLFNADKGSPRLVLLFSPT